MIEKELENSIKRLEIEKSLLLLWFIVDPSEKKFKPIKFENPQAFSENGDLPIPASGKV